MYSLERLWINVRSSLWFVPSLLVLGSIGLAFGLIRVEEVVSPSWLNRWPRLFGAGAEGSRGMLTAIATSMVTVAGVTFSITVVALAQASSQYSPLILRNFMRDRANQVVLGVFGGIFVYCLIVLRSIRGGAEEFVPSIAVFVALLHAVAAIGVLLFFIHHIATILQASSILAVVARNTMQAIDSLFPEELGEGAVEAGERDRTPHEDARLGTWHPVCPRETGYIQSVRSDAMLSLACERGLIVRMERGIGDFAIADVPIASVALDSALDDDTITAVQNLFIIGEYRTAEQDAAFGVRQIVDMAVKALSPGINDPTTACSCIDYLAATLVRFASRRMTTRERYTDGQLRVLAIGPTFESMADLAFDQIRQHSGSDTNVLVCLLDAIELAALHARGPSRQQIMLRHISLVSAHATRVLDEEADRQRIGRRAADAVRAIEAVARGCAYAARSGPASRLEGIRRA